MKATELLREHQGAVKKLFCELKKLGDERLRALGEQMESSDGMQRGGEKGAGRPPQRSAHAHSERHI